MIFAKVKDVNKIEEISKDIQRYLDKEHGEKTFEVMSTRQLAQRIVSITNILSFTLGAIAAISLVVAGIGIANTMLMSVMERTREIGIMKAIGATNTNIMQMFLVESILISFIGGSIGCGLGYTFSKVINQASAYIQFITLKTSVSSNLFLIGMGFSLIVGVVSGLFPARRAAKLNPVEALRYE
ncbi:MAG: ABC transporter permease, partial [Candidatus Heimdallarchaeota archaeon]